MKWGKVDFEQLKRLQKNIEKLEKQDRTKMCEEAAKELAARMLTKLIKKTPVGRYKGDEYTTKTGKTRHKSYKTINFTTSKGQTVKFKAKMTGKNGGTLRRGWVANSHKEAEIGTKKTVSAEEIKNYVSSIVVRKQGANYVIELINPVEYASYVNSGHRTRNHTGWVPRSFFC